jgi:phosphoglycerol transferase MdoB-like AlkP superfamily enzyme
MRIIEQLLKYFLSVTGLFFVGRLSLFVLYFDRFKDSDVNYWLTFLYGLKMDTIVVSLLLVIPLILLTLMPQKVERRVTSFLRCYYLITISAMLFMELATFPFLNQYDVRPNYLFVEYLKYPKEVIGMITGGFKVEIAVSFAILFLFIRLFLKYARFNFSNVFEIGHPKRALLFIPLLLVLFIGVRSSFGHRPANISDAMYSSNRIVNEITKNSFYSVCYAVYANQKYKADATGEYGKMEPAEALQRVKKCLNIQSADRQSPLSREAETHFKREHPKNLVIFLQESLGAQFVETLGGEKGITPNLNRLSREGVLFENAFSNGTRSIRGIAGSVAGNFSIPGKGVLKRNKSQTDYFTLSSLLEPFGYQTLFLYGGESRFDNMKGWFLGNGFDRIIDEPEFTDYGFKGTWGVSDGDLVNRANKEFIKLHDKNQPFAAVMFSSSNHSPFEFPEGKIELVDGVPEKSVKNAVKYADFAIGDFIEKAKKETYYKDTVFVIVADHNVRVYGDDMVPVNMFHIPALILGGGVEPMTYSGLATQPDVLATALDMIGLDLTYPIMGHSVFSDKKQELSLMQFNDSYALRVKDKVAVIRPKKEPLTFIYKNDHLEATAHDVELEKNTLAFVLSLTHLYSEKLYR